MGTGKTYSTKYLLDSNNSSGVAGQVLSTTSTGIDWVDANTVPGSGLWLANGNDIYNSNSGNVGIGTTSPGYKLEVAGTARITSALTFGGNVNNIIAGTGSSLDFKSNGEYYFRKGANTNLTILSGGNVGIGTTLPDAPLHILKAAGGANIVTALKLDPDDATTGSGVSIDFNASTTNTGASLVGSRIVGARQGGNASGFLALYTSPDASGSVPLERMRIDSAGMVGIGIIPGNGFGLARLSLGTGAVANEIIAFASASGGNAELRNTSSTGTFTFTNSDGLSEKMRINATGNVGIGTTSPTQKLEVVGNIKADSTGNTQVILESGGSCVMDLLNAQSEAYLRTTTAHDLHFRTTNLNRMVIKAGGNVGIGTTSPGEKLTVKGLIGIQRTVNTATSTISMEGNFIFNAYAGYAHIFAQNNTEKMRITSAGNVGIGETSPKAKLNITGVSGTPAAPTAGVSAGILRIESSNAGVGLDIGQQPLAPYSMWMQVGNTSNSTGNTYPLLLNPIGGNVGIGTTSPLSKLHVEGTGDLVRLVSTNAGSAGVQMDMLQFSASPADDDIMGLINMGGYYSGTNSAYFSSIRTIATDVSARKGALSFFTRSEGDFTEKMRIDSAGSIKFNAYNGTNNTGSPTHILGTDANGLIVKSTAGSSIGPWLPLAAGSGERVTGDLYISDKLYMRPSSTYGDGYNVMTVTGTNSAPYTSTLSFSNYAQSNVMVIQGSNVGIGTTSPAYQLTVSKNSGFHEAGLDIFQASAGAALQVLRIISDAHGGGGRTGDIAFLTANSATATEKMRILSGGNVGIGTDSPVQPFQVNGQVLFRTTTADGSKNRFQLIPGGSSDAANLYLYYGDTGDGTLSVRINAQGASYFNGGNVGIGTTSPSTQLEIASNTAAGALKITQSAEVTGNAMVYIDNNSASNKPALRIDVTAGGNATDTHGVLINNSGPGYGLIVNGGNVGIGTTSPANKLNVNGDIGYTGVIGQGSIYGNTGNSSFSTMQLYDPATGYTTLNNQSYGYYFNTSGGTKVTILNSGNVGIGLTNPGQKLEVSGNIKAHDGYIRSEDGATGDFMQMFNDGANTGQSFITTSSTELVLIPQNGKLQLKGENSGSGNNASLEIYNALNAAVKVKLNSSGVSYFNGGNVGINQDNPLTRLDVIGGLSGSTAQQFNTRTATPPSGSTAIFRNGGNSSITILGDNQVVSNVFGSLNFGIWSDMTDGQIIYSFQDQFMAFSTANSEKLRIESGGEVGINITNPSATLHLKAIASNGVPFKLESHPNTSVSQMLIYSTKAYNSTDAWYNLVCEAGDGSGGQTNTCIIERDGDLRNKNNSYGQISDSRLKENIIDATPKLEDVMKVKVKNFNFIGEDLKQIGVVAQELEEVFPGLVKEDKQPDVNGEEGGIYKSVKYSVLVPILLKAMQEQQDQIEDLKTRITKLEN